MAERLDSWIGRQETTSDVVAASQAQALAATLGTTNGPQLEGDPLPFMWNWIYCTQKAPRQEIGSDGHPRRGGFLPPVPLPRRMFAGAEMKMFDPIKVGSRVAKTSTIIDVVEKSGRSGPLVFVKVMHEYTTDDVLNLVDTHDIVYRETVTEPVTEVKPVQAFGRPEGKNVASELVVPDTVLLFRYSALIFVSHRIHYDHPYATETEGYPGLLVHGPLIATLLAELARKSYPGRQFKRFSFMAKAPIFDTQPFRLTMQQQQDKEGFQLTAERADCVPAMSAELA